MNGRFAVVSVREMRPGDATSSQGHGGKTTIRKSVLLMHELPSAAVTPDVVRRPSNMI